MIVGFQAQVDPHVLDMVAPPVNYHFSTEELLQMKEAFDVFKSYLSLFSYTRGEMYIDGQVWNG